MGARVAYDDKLGKKVRLRVYGEFARSMGIDRKPVTDRDVDTTGNAFGGGLVSDITLSKKNSLELNVEWYRFDGSTYASDGLEF